MAVDSRSASLRHIHHSIQVLGYPKADNLTDDTLLASGQRRFELIEWLFEQFPEDSLPNHRLAENLKSKETEADQVLRLTNAAHSFGLCRNGDIEVVQGLCADADNRNFLSTLVDLVRLASELKTKNETAETELERSEVVMNHFVSNANAIFSQEVVLFPPDIQSKLPKNTTCPDIAALEQERRDLTNDVRRAHAQLEHTRDQFESALEHDPENVVEIRQQFCETLRGYCRILKKFNEVFDADVQSWLEQPTPHLRGLGKRSKGLRELLQNMKTMLHNIRNVAGSMDTLVNKSKLPTVIAADSFNEDSLVQLEDIAKVYEQTIQRLERKNQQR